jgi:hypothetical protein
MRKAQLIVGSVFVAGLVAACGSTSSNNPPGSQDGGGADSGGATPGVDSGGDSASTVDAGQDSAPSCVIGDADISTLSPPDASLNDAGASVGACIACAKTSCSADVTACNGDCPCNTALVCIFECIGGVGNTILTCAEQCGGLATVDSTEEALLGCADSKCKAECGQGGGGMKPTDAGGLDASGEDASDVDAADAN